MLAVLPVAGMALAGLAGARPWAVLLGSPGGVGLLLLGVTLDLCGVAWLRRLARRVEAVG